jgi:hypothetical protein
MDQPAPVGFPDDPVEARGVVLLGFGETIMRFQFLEMTFFSILAIRMKKGITLDQGIAKLTGWTTQNMGRLVGTLGLPTDLKDEAEQALDARNYLVHSFMRDRAMKLHDAASCEEIAEELVEVQRRLDEFEERLEAYARNLGVDDLTDEDWAKLGLSDPNDPAAVIAWLETMDEE